jgi:hypothetical protein
MRKRDPCFQMEVFWCNAAELFSSQSKLDQF